MRFLAYARGGSCNFQLPLGSGSSYSITLIGGTHLSVDTNGTVDHTCYIKHSRLEFLLKYSPTCCVLFKILMKCVQLLFFFTFHLNFWYLSVVTSTLCCYIYSRKEAKKKNTIKTGINNKQNFKAILTNVFRISETFSWQYYMYRGQAQRLIYLKRN